MPSLSPNVIYLELRYLIRWPVYRGCLGGRPSAVFYSTGRRYTRRAA